MIEERPFKALAGGLVLLALLCSLALGAALFAVSVKYGTRWGAQSACYGNWPS